MFVFVTTKIIFYLKDLKMDKRALYEGVLKLNPGDYFNFISQVHMEYPHQSKELTNRIVNLWRKEQKRDVKVNIHKFLYFHLLM